MSTGERLLDSMLDYRSTAKALNGFRLLSFGKTQDRIETVQRRIKIITAAKQCGISKKPEMKTLGCVFSDETYCSKVVELLAEELPVCDPDMYDDGEVPAYLMADAIGMNAWCEEEVDNLISNPSESEFDLKFSIIAFLELINYQIDDPEQWDNCRSHFHWPTESQYYIQQCGYDLDHAFIKEQLKQKGAPPELYTLVMLTLFPPEDNYLLCVSADEWDNDPTCMQIEIDTESIRHLRSLWKQAKPLIKQIVPAMEWVVWNPQIIPVLGEILEQSQPERSRIRV